MKKRAIPVTSLFILLLLFLLLFEKRKRKEEKEKEKEKEKLFKNLSPSSFVFDGSKERKKKIKTPTSLFLLTSSIKWYWKRNLSSSLERQTCVARAGSVMTMACFGWRGRKKKEVEKREGEVRERRRKG